MTKINWYNGKTANSASDMQKLCDAIEENANKNKMFKHHLIIKGYSNLYAYMTLINTSNEIITNNILFNILPLDTEISATGHVSDSTSVMINIKKFNSGFNFTYINFSITNNNLTKVKAGSAVSISNVTVVDNVEETI